MKIKTYIKTRFSDHWIANRKKNNLRLCGEHLENRVADITSYPLEMQIEVSCECNLRCIMCPYHFERNSLDKIIELELIKKLRPLLPNIIRVYLMGAGEPLLHPRFTDICRILTAYNIWIVFSTNATLMTEKIAEQLVDLQVQHITVSLDGATPETYNFIRRGADFINVIHNIEGLINFRERRNQVKPVVCFAPVMLKSNVLEAGKFVELAHNMGVTNVHFEGMFEVHDGTPYARFYEKYNLDHVQESERLEAFKTAYDLGKKYNIHITSRVQEISRVPEFAKVNPAPKKKSSIMCEDPWANMYIRHDGLVATCCAREPVFGDLNTSSAKDIWFGKPYTDFRSTFAQNQIQEWCKVCLQNQRARPILGELERLMTH